MLARSLCAVFLNVSIHDVVFMIGAIFLILPAADLWDTLVQLRSTPHRSGLKCSYRYATFALRSLQAEERVLLPISTRAAHYFKVNLLPR